MPLLLLLKLLMQSPKPTTFFPSDAKPFVQANDADLIQTVCPGHQESGGKVECGENCPKSSGLDGGTHQFDWTLLRFTRGHFLSATSDDAVISTDGCEPHASNWGGSLLVTRRAGAWRMIWYKAGVETSNCHRVPLTTGREILVCLGQFGMQGSLWTQLYLEDIAHPQRSLMASESHIFQIFDFPAPCGNNFPGQTTSTPVTYAFIDKVEFASNKISITFHKGDRPMTLEEVKACLAEQESATPPSSFSPIMRAYRVDFVFTGQTYKLTAASAALAQRLGLK